MMTAAEGAEEFYVSDKNDKRQESLEEARAIDRKLNEAWIGHPQYKIIKNRKKGFNKKVEYCIKQVLSIIGMP